MARNFGGNRLRISKEQREEILRLYTSGEPRKAQLYAMSLGLREEYAYRLARERGAIPFMSMGFVHRERAVTQHSRPQSLLAETHPIGTTAARHYGCPDAT